MQSKAATVSEYVASLPPDRRQAIEAIRAVIRKNLDKGFEETMQYGMIGYNVPHRLYPPGYHCDPKQPLCYAGLASQKNHISVYLMSVYNEDEKWFKDAWAKSGKKLDMGKCCVRFKKLEDAALDVIGEAIRRAPLKEFVEKYEATLEKHGTKHPGKAKDAWAKQDPKVMAEAKSVKPSTRKPVKKSSKKQARKAIPSRGKKTSARRA